MREEGSSYLPAQQSGACVPNFRRGQDHDGNKASPFFLNLRYALERDLDFLNRRGFPRRPGCDSRCWLGWRPAKMARAYSLDLRERVVAAVAEGSSCRQVASRFKVSVA